MAKEIIANEEMEQETTVQIEETKKKGLPGWVKLGLTFLGGAATSAILIGLFGGSSTGDESCSCDCCGDYSNNADSDE